jgi:hypothetical protein
VKLAGDDRLAKAVVGIGRVQLDRQLDVVKIIVNNVDNRPR